MSSGYQEQGWGEVVPGRGAALVTLLETRDGIHTIVELADGSLIDAYDTASGRDVGDEWEHVILNAGRAPVAEKRDVWFALTSDIQRVVDPLSGAILYEATKNIQDEA